MAAVKVPRFRYAQNAGGQLCEVYKALPEDHVTYMTCSIVLF